VKLREKNVRRTVTQSKAAVTEHRLGMFSSATPSIPQANQKAFNFYAFDSTTSLALFFGFS